MSTDQPAPGSPQDPFAKPPGDQAGGPYNGAQGTPPPGNPYGGDPYGGGPATPGGPGGSDNPYGGGPGGPANPYGGGGPGGPANPYGGGPGGPGGPGDPNNPYGGAPQDPLAGMPPLADGGKRVLARVIDVIIVLIPAGLLDWAAGGTDNFSSGKSAVGGAFFAVLGFLYEWFMTRSTGQTVGKKLMKLRVAMLENGSVPTSAAAGLRALVLWLPAFCCSCVWFVILGITVLFDKPYKQGLHDKAAKTVVVQTA
ncbi:RDD family protein [Streptomyces sp. NPDC087422]|uniref:RDD family protein n=1 Tax=Streptomyces sp. NPDC087422 TaxID=3365786 RepID=UPI00380876FA